MKVRFQRQGTSTHLILRGLPDGVCVHWYDAAEGTTQLLMEKYSEDSGYSTRISQEDTTVQAGDFQKVQEHIKAFTGQPVELYRGVQSYYISAKDRATDVDFIGDVNVSKMTVREMMKATGLSLVDYFEPWLRDEQKYKAFCDILWRSPKALHDMRFDAFHDLIHGNSHKANFAKMVHDGLLYVGAEFINAENELQRIIAKNDERYLLERFFEDEFIEYAVVRSPEITAKGLVWSSSGYYFPPFPYKGNSALALQEAMQRLIDRKPIHILIEEADEVHAYPYTRFDDAMKKFTSKTGKTISLADMPEYEGIVRLPVGMDEDDSLGMSDALYTLQTVYVDGPFDEK